MFVVMASLALLTYRGKGVTHPVASPSLLIIVAV